MDARSLENISSSIDAKHESRPVMSALDTEICARQPGPGGTDSRTTKSSSPLGLHPQDLISAPATTDGCQRRWCRQCGEGTVLVDDADRNVERKKWKTRNKLANVVFEYLGVSDNCHRRHTALVYGHRRSTTSPHLAGTHCNQVLATESGSQIVGQFSRNIRPRPATLGRVGRARGQFDRRAAVTNWTVIAFFLRGYRNGPSNS